MDFLAFKVEVDENFGQEKGQKKRFKPTFFTRSKKVEKEKILFTQMIKMCQKISTVLKKKWNFGHFCDFGQNAKMAKNPFYL